MATEQVEVTDFFQRHKPFSDLPTQELSHVASRVEIAYYKAGVPILTFGQDNDQWFVIRSGAVEVFRRDGELYNRLGEGNFFGELGIMRNRPVRLKTPLFISSMLKRSIIFLTMTSNLLILLKWKTAVAYVILMRTEKKIIRC